jgi:hypothetical protein
MPCLYFDEEKGTCKRTGDIYLCAYVDDCKDYEDDE